MKLTRSILATSFGPIAALLVAGSGIAHAQVPQTINYQGRISADGSPFTGNGQFKFALVSDDGSTTFWSHDGTSTAGSEPTAAVSLPVAAGLYVAPLGDTAIAGMQTLPPSVFANPSVNLRVWFNDGVNGSQLLAPDQRVVSVGYAMMSAGVQNGAITTAMIAPGAVTPDKLASDSSIPPGTVVAFAGSTAPTGWALCDGAAFDGTQSQFAALFAAIGLTYGGSASTFQVPDLRGRTAVGAGQGPTLSDRVLATKFGAETHTLTAAQMPAHSHGVSDPGHFHSYLRAVGGGQADNASGGNPYAGNVADNTGSKTTGISIQSTGGNQPHNITQPSIALNYIIKL